MTLTKHNPFHQDGSVLIVSLILLLILTVIGVSSINNIGMNERMAGNYKDHDLAFQAAESALAAGEKEAEGLAGIFLGAGLDEITDYFTCSDSKSNCFTPTCLEGLCFNGSYPAISSGGSSAGICSPSNPATPLWETPSTWTTAGKAAIHTSQLTGLAEKPKYIIEFKCYVLADPQVPASTSGPNYGTDWAYMFRITALGTGSTLQSKAMVQSTFKVLR